MHSDLGFFIKPMSAEKQLHWNMSPIVYCDF